MEKPEWTREKLKQRIAELEKNRAQWAKLARAQLERKLKELEG